MQDPVCGMMVDVGSLTVDGYPDVAFCSEDCRSVFVAVPDRYYELDDGKEGAGAVVEEGEDVASRRSVAQQTRQLPRPAVWRPE